MMSPDFEDFLLGVPSQYNQSQLQPFYGRNKYWGLYAQDGWRMRSNLTLNYGLRWDRIEPWYEKYNQLSVFVPGAQSVALPGRGGGCPWCFGLPSSPRRWKVVCCSFLHPYGWQSSSLS